MSLVDQLQIVAAIGFAFCAEGNEQGRFILARGDNEFTAAAVRNAVAFAKVIKPLPALDTEPRLKASRWIIKPRMDDLAIAGRGGRTEFLFAFQNDDGKPAHRQFAGRRKPDHARSDDDGVDVSHVFLSMEGPFEPTPTRCVNSP